jgi:hypothetical protein
MQCWRPLPAWVVVASVGAMAPACATPPPVSHLEDKARLDVPVAICRHPVEPGDLDDAGSPHPDAYWSVIVPAFQGFGSALQPTDVDCVGETHAAAFRGRPASPASIGADDAVVVAGDDGMQVVWLRAFRSAESAAEGPVAIVRPRPSEVDVYAIGSYRGSAAHSRFAFGRLGASRIVVATDDGCADVKVDVECESTLTFYAMVGGKLVAAADSPAQRIHYGTLKGLGRVQYRLTTDPPAFDKLTVRVHERLEVRDANEEDVRKAEGDRAFVLGEDGRLVAQQDSLWSQLPAAP